MWTKVFTTLCLIGIAAGLDMESAKEQPCFNITKTVPGDPKFISGLKAVYYPILSRLELYRTGMDLLQKDPKDISESTLYYDLCSRFVLGPKGTITSHGFEGRSRVYKTEMIKPNMELFNFAPADGKGFSGMVYTTMTDNKSYFVSATCTEDNQMVWSVGSMYPTLPKETRDKVVEHVLSLGFKKEFITELRYDYCDLDDMYEMGTTTSSVAESAL